ncbi:ESX secretion-associated protein EspG [Nocardia stercoris]|uniref:ESX secretion-associated protein EspG n=1 Tax=Nocardia stercoris TaxID=2483361 RepID=A0A3M2L4J0_9NOCA|nr:ESX secretion-associated protein EspG [Nocardia stercoris]RMI30795.1 hypothetical protein EBN03_19210 [Nocardia stercoris]
MREFTPDEFLHVWSETGLDRYPAPLVLRGSTPLQADRDRLAAELHTRLPLGGDPDLTRILRAAADPDSVVTLTGHTARPMRVYAAVTAGFGVVLAQRSTADPVYGGNVLVETGPAGIIPKIFTTIAGGPVRAGRGAALVENVDRMRAEEEAGWAGIRETTGQRMRRLITGPRDGLGCVEVRHRVRSEHPHTTLQLHWIDVPGDGRYTLRALHHELHVTPCDEPTLRREIARLIHDEPEPDW